METQTDMWSLGVIVYLLIGGYSPFHSFEWSLYKREVLQGEFEFHSEYWRTVSHSAKKLIKGMLNTDPTNRLTARQALESEWFRGNEEALANVDLSSNVKKIKDSRYRVQGFGENSYGCTKTGSRRTRQRRRCLLDHSTIFHHSGLDEESAG
mgnify:CR=1 FL=1